MLLSGATRKKRPPLKPRVSEVVSFTYFGEISSKRGFWFSPIILFHDVTYGALGEHNIFLILAALDCCAYF